MVTIRVFIANVSSNKNVMQSLDDGNVIQEKNLTKGGHTDSTESIKSVTESDPHLSQCDLSDVTQ